jgi:hypothetical protein
VERLLKVNGINVNAARQQSGSTPLFFASQEGHAQVVNLLIQAKADVNISRTDGEVSFSLWFLFVFRFLIQDQSVCCSDICCLKGQRLCTLLLKMVMTKLSGFF